MLFKNFSEITPKAKHSLAQASVAPRPIAWVTTLGTSGIVNLAPFSYFGLLTPDHLTLSVLRRKGEMKDTARNLVDTKEAVFHAVSLQNLASVDLTGKEIPSEESEVELAGLTLQPSTIVQVPGITDALMRMEARVLTHTELPGINDTAIVADVFVLQILGVHVANDLYDAGTGHVDTSKLAAVARMAGPQYAEARILEGFKRAF